MWFTNDVHKVNTTLGLKRPKVRHFSSQMWFYYFLPMCPWASYLSSNSLPLLITQVAMMRVHTEWSWGWSEMNYIKPLAVGLAQSMHSTNDTANASYCVPYLALTFMPDTCDSHSGMCELGQKYVSSLKEKGSGIFIPFWLHFPPAPWHNDDKKEPGSKMLILQYPWDFVKVSVLPMQGEQPTTPWWDNHYGAVPLPPGCFCSINPLILIWFPKETSML